MLKEEIIQLISANIKSIRLEARLTQDRMAEIVGLSKKTLVQIEKDRLIANWSTVVTTCAIFRESQTVIQLLGENALEIIETVALESKVYRKDWTMGGVIWWKVIEENENYKVQQNHISQHYRIIDKENYRIFSSFDYEEVIQRWEEINKG